jgi:hypothetical protein
MVEQNDDDTNKEHTQQSTKGRACEAPQRRCGQGVGEGHDCRRRLRGWWCRKPAPHQFVHEGVGGEDGVGDKRSRWRVSTEWAQRRQLNA